MTKSCDITLRILAAGSLRAVLLAHADAHFDIAFGGAGLLRERIERGERCDLFLSADLANPHALARTAGATVRSFIRNQIVVVARADVGLRSDNFVARLLDPAVRVATSTPGTDPGGDWAIALFRRADSVSPGAAAILTAKALHLAGGREISKLPAGSHPVAHFLSIRAADVFVCYRSMTLDLGGDFDVVAPPPEIRVVAEYGLVVLASDPRRQAVAAEFANALTCPEWQRRFGSYGFERLRA
jgi:ABC-type molybdate transport system substrate-binding protein